MTFTLGYSTYALPMVDPFEAVRMIKDVGYHLHWVWVNNDQGKKHFHILPVSYIEKMGANLSAEDLKSFNRFIGDERNLLSNSNINVDEYEFNVETGEYILR